MKKRDSVERSSVHPKDINFRLEQKESMPHGFIRAIDEQLAAAATHLSAPEPLADAVHEARKALKRSRALLRLIRPALGPTYRVVNTELRDLGRSLSELRDTQALASELEGLKKGAPRGASSRLLEETRQRLLQRKREIVRDFTTRGEAARIAKNLDELRSRAASWPVEQSTAATVVAAIARTVRRGRKAFARSRKDGRAEDFHEWRKRAKDLRYQMEFLGHLWPHVLTGYSKSAKELEQQLGKDHNLSVLRDLLKDGAGPAKRDLKLALRFLDSEQQELRKQAEDIGHLLYADKPKQWTKRIERCWASRG